ncbi:MAG: DegT/DnrJ/EryC1/StrS aminotransferase family protein [Rhizobiaceae bacterium]|nr:DegT/DnrJ/EryC1/StrS aminotransferase family protein [Parvibaculum sp.]MBO6725860.1 DegT/DnrJ/EryC1/StrS aminotransferase family protein [Rhizobiaceae bacterium]
MMPFIDLAAQQARIRDRLDSAIGRVLDQGNYIMGDEVSQLERELGAFCGAKHTLSCANGTDALSLALMALGVKAGDAIFVPSFTFAATAEVVPFIGATPIFVDVLPDTFNLDVESLTRAISYAKSEGLTPKAVIPVDLFGLAADYDAIVPVAHDNGLAVIDDAAQGFGAGYRDRVVGAIGDITTTSFFPAKPLGCYGDGGAIFTEDDELAALIDSYRIHGKGSHKYDNERVGMNSRLDTLQAAILIEKLAIFSEEIEERQNVAARYAKDLNGRYETPVVPEGLKSTWAQYTIKTKSEAERNEVLQKAKQAGIPTAIYYPIPLHAQTAFRDFPRDPAGLPVSDDIARRVISLPMHPYLGAPVQDKIVEVIA